MPLKVVGQAAIERTKLLLMEFRSNGATSQMGSATPRQLYKYVKNVVSSFGATESTDFAGIGSTVNDQSLHAKPLEMRDLRRLQQPFSSRNQPAFIVRLYSILVNFDPLRCVILHDRLIVLVPDGADGVLDELEQRLNRSLLVGHALSHADLEEGEDGEASLYSKHSSKSGQSFPFLAVEAVLRTVLNNLESELAEIAIDVKSALKWLVSPSNAVGLRELDGLRQLKNKVASQDARAQMTRQAFEECLNDDEDMALMAFVDVCAVNSKSEAATGTSGDGYDSETDLRQMLRRIQPPDHEPRPFSTTRSSANPVDPTSTRPATVVIEDHEVFEMLFEFHLQTVNTVQTSLDLLRTELTNGEQFHLLRLTTARNKLLTASLMMNILSMCTAIGSFLGSIFGMNLVSGLEYQEGMFQWVAATASTAIILGTLVIYLGLRSMGVLSNGIS